VRERLRAVQTRILERWNALDRSQKIRLAAIAAVFLLTLGVTLYINLRTKMEVLVDNRDLTVVSDMQSALDDAGIKNKVVSNGRGLAVDQKRVVDAQVLIARQGLLEDAGSGDSGFTYLDALNFSGMGTTESIKRENMKKVAETELSNALRLFDGINKATVNLTIPDDNYYFVKPVDTARASAVLTVSRPLTKSESMQVARFLCASVKGLTLDNIEISDQNYNSVYSGLQEASGDVGSRYDQELLRKNDIEMKIKVSLSPLFDAVTVINDNLKFNWDKFTETSNTISSPAEGGNTGVILKETTEKRTSSATGGGAAPGVSANDQASNTYQTQNGGASSAVDKTASTEYGYTTSQKTVESASGILIPAESTIAVMVYRNKIYAQSQMNSDLNGQTWEEFKANTRETALDIDFSPIKDIISKGTGLTAANISVYGYEVPVFVDAEIKTMNAQRISMFAVLTLLLMLLAWGVLRGAPKEKVTETEPELSVEDLLETTRMEEVKQAERLRLQDIELDKESEAKKLIEKFVDERPEAAAQLLRNWLNEYWE
jgi:flagellar M-ring protein FliF